MAVDAEASEEEKDLLNGAAAGSNIDNDRIRRHQVQFVQVQHDQDSKACYSSHRRSRTLSESSYFSAASSVMSSSDSESLPGNNSSSHPTLAYTYRAPDGGWGWVIVVASFMVNMIADGVTFSFGVLFDELQNEFKESKAVTAGVVSVFHAVPLLSGPIASALTDRYIMFPDIMFPNIMFPNIMFPNIMFPNIMF